MSTSRRGFIACCSGLAAGSVLAYSREQKQGCIVGEPSVEPIGQAVLADGGNAVDALVATALASAVTQMHQTGIGGYGAHGIFVSENKEVIAIDANSTAPASFTSDIFKPDSGGRVTDQKNQHGWLSAGVPGVLAGLAKAAEKFGTWSLHDLLQPAIKLSREGFELSVGTATAIKNSEAKLRLYPASAALYLPSGAPLRAGEKFSNPNLAEMLSTVAQANSIAPFYSGDIAGVIADDFARNGGLVNREDLRNYEAKLVKPLRMKWGDFEIFTAPVTAGGYSVIQTLELLQKMDWTSLPEPQRTHAQVEAMRWCWRDRLLNLSDGQNRSAKATRTGSQGVTDFQTAAEIKMRSASYLSDAAEEILVATRGKSTIRPEFRTATQSGTLSFSAADGSGNMAALTLTHGEAFGSRVTVGDLGLTLGHGMSRFDVDPSHPNAPGPGKRPLNNMCPTLVFKQGRPYVAVGGRGGRKIPNAVLEFLIHLVARRESPQVSISAPRLHTEGGKNVEYQKGLSESQSAYLRELGYQTKTGTSATLSAVAINDDQIDRWMI